MLRPDELEEVLVELELLEELVEEDEVDEVELELELLLELEDEVLDEVELEVEDELVEEVLEELELEDEDELDCEFGSRLIFSSQPWILLPLTKRKTNSSVNARGSF